MPTLPSATTTFANLATWSQPMFDSLLPYAYLAGGLLLAVGLIWFLIRLAGHATDKMSN